jgi:predicted CXXCH cytochrome family protein
MRVAKSKIACLSATLLIGVAALVWMLSYGGVATAGTYTGSAHGNAGYGVNRSGTECPTGTPCPQGDCTHCHDTFNDSICGVNDLMLFKTEYFCVWCHKHPDSSYQVGMPYQGCYSYKFGGAYITCPSNVMSAFLFVDQTGGTGLPVSNCGSDKGSAHNLADIASLLEGRWGFSDTSDDINPCEGCHNPHKAQRHSYPSGSTGGSPIARPSTHDGDWDVYGADPTQRMNRYTYDYEPPYKYPAGSNGREWPSGATAPDVNTVCVDCHGLPWRSVVSTRYGYLEVVTGGGPHGTYRSDKHTPYYGGLIDPYENWDFVTLMCTDCHEPHGSPNEFLLRTCVNGKNNIVITQPGHYREFCTACHWLGSFHSSDNDCTGCHYHPVNL